MGWQLVGRMTGCLACFQQQVKVKSLENAEKNPKAIDSWIESISELHRCKPPATVHYARCLPLCEQCRVDPPSLRRGGRSAPPARPPGLGLFPLLPLLKPTLVSVCRPMPDIDTLMQEWSPEFEDLLGKVCTPGVQSPSLGFLL